MDTHSLLEIQLTGPQATASPCHWHVDDSFFEALDEDNIQHGALDVTCSISGSEAQNAFCLHFAIEGTIEYPCNRCLEPMTLHISTEDSIHVVLGSQYTDDGETIVVPEIRGNIDVAWNVYEMIALAIPINHVHPDGQCNQEMLQLLQAYSPAEEN